MSVQFEYDYDKATAAMSKFNQSDVDELKDWTVKLDNSKNVPKDLSDKQIVLFYNACGSDVEKAKKCIEKYYLCRKNAPEFFTNRKVDCEVLRESLEALEFSVLPAQSPEGYDIIFHRLHNTDPSKYNLEAGIKLLLMTVDLCLYTRGPQPGVIFLFDMRGVRLTHLTRLSVGTLRKFFTYIQEALPLRMVAIHIMNVVSFFDAVMAVLRPFMDKKLMNMIKLHTTTEDLTEFYKTIPRSALPPDYGGELADSQVLHEENTRLLRRMEEHFEQEQRQRGAEKGDVQVVSRFSKLDID